MLKEVFYTSPLFIIGLVIFINNKDFSNSIINEKLVDMYWFGLKTYTKCKNSYKSYYKQLNRFDIISIILDGEEIVNNKCVNSAVIDNKISCKKLLESLSDTSQSILTGNNKNYDMIFYKIPCKDEKYNYLIKRINNLDTHDFNEEIKQIPACIIGCQIDVTLNNETCKTIPIEIKKTCPIDLDIDNYYLENNILLDEKFVNYWLKKYYNITEYKNYSISFFDKNTMEIEYLAKGEFVTIKNSALVVTRKKASKEDEFINVDYEQELL